MKRSCHRSGIASLAVDRVNGLHAAPASDDLAVEDPLEVRLAGDGISPPRTVAVTMRTPGDDVDLAAGFLFTEGIVAGKLR